MAAKLITRQIPGILAKTARYLKNLGEFRGGEGSGRFHGACSMAPKGFLAALEMTSLDSRHPERKVILTALNAAGATRLANQPMP